MTFYRVESVAHFGAAPEGAAIINLDDAAPFRGLSLSPAALAEVRRLHPVRFGTGRGAYLRGAYLTGAYLTGAVGLASPEEEAANIAAAVEAIAAEPQHWDQAVWHGGGFDPAAAVAVGSCGTAHCLAGWLQTLLPIGDERRELDPETCGWVLAPRAASAGWFASRAHPDLQARVDAAIAKRNASPA
jgi:uncharacterized protein YjbI with pentapeptide repeats